MMIEGHRTTHPPVISISQRTDIEIRVLMHFPGRESRAARQTGRRAHAGQSCGGGVVMHAAMRRGRGLGMEVIHAAVGGGQLLLLAIFGVGRAGAGAEGGAHGRSVLVRLCLGAMQGGFDFLDQIVLHTGDEDIVIEGDDVGRRCCCCRC